MSLKYLKIILLCYYLHYLNNIFFQIQKKYCYILFMLFELSIQPEKEIYNIRQNITNKVIKHKLLCFFIISPYTIIYT